MHRRTWVCAVALIAITPLPARAAITLDYPTLSAAGGELTSASYSSFTLAAEPVVGVCAGPSTNCAAGFVACLEGKLSPLDAGPTASEFAFGFSRVGPNPTNRSASFAFVLARPGHVDLRVFDGSGRRVRSLASGWMPAGTHLAHWDGERDGAGLASPGVYYCRLTSGSERAVRRLIVVR